MMRVEVNMNASFRGRVDQYAQETGKTMPQAYKELMEAGLAVVESDVGIGASEDGEVEDVSKVLELGGEEYEIVIKNNGQ